MLLTALCELGMVMGSDKGSYSGSRACGVQRAFVILVFKSLVTSSSPTLHLLCFGSAEEVNEAQIALSDHQGVRSVLPLVPSGESSRHFS